MVTIQNIKDSEEIKELIVSAQRQMDALRIYRTFNQTYFDCF